MYTDNSLSKQMSICRVSSWRKGLRYTRQSYEMIVGFVCYQRTWHINVLSFRIISGPTVTLPMDCYYWPTQRQRYLFLRLHKHERNVVPIGSCPLDHKTFWTSGPVLLRCSSCQHGQTSCSSMDKRTRYLRRWQTRRVVSLLWSHSVDDDKGGYNW